MNEYRQKISQRNHDGAVRVVTEGLVNNYSKNIGQHGLLCYTRKHIDEMTLLDLKFQFPRCSFGCRNDMPEGWVECQGVVVSCEPVRRIKGDRHYVVSVYFSKMSTKSKNILSEYVKKQKMAE